MINKTDEFPIAQMDQSLGHVVCHVNDCDFFVSWGKRLVGQQGVVDDPGLWHGLLRVIQLVLLLIMMTVLIIYYVSAEHVKLHVATRILSVEDRSKDARQ